MKKLRLILVALFVGITAMSASAQFANSGSRSNSRNNSSDVSVKYQGDFNVGVFAGDATMLTVGTTQGAMFSKYFFAGVSVNAEVNTSDFGYWNIAPMASLRGYYPVNDNFRVFLNPELGVTIGVAGEYNSGSAFEYRLTTGFEYKKLQLGIGCGGAGTTMFLAKIGVVF